jgi:hypothetical protein
VAKVPSTVEYDPNTSKGAKGGGSAGVTVKVALKPYETELLVVR